MPVQMVEPLWAQQFPLYNPLGIHRYTVDLTTACVALQPLKAHCGLVISSNTLG